MLKNFFNISDLSSDQIQKILSNNLDFNNLKKKNIGLIFEKSSTRTRLSFTVGITSLGGNPIDIRFEDLNISREESFEDTFRAMECYLDGLVYRTNSHQKLILASSYFKKPIINALSDLSHPCQIISDLLTIQENFGTINCNILWMGDMNNVCFSLVEAANLLEDLNLTICTPASISAEKKWILNSNTSIINNINDIDLKSVNCVMTDVFISMNDEDSFEKIKLLSPYKVTSEIMLKTSEDSVFMHCLPAKIGHEVTEDVFKSDKSIVWRQAYNRMVAQKKLLQYLYS
tara:strand:+ start:21618 stop:22481 length:864 start_codon:yes stop_codon:yes gene_type:complete